MNNKWLLIIVWRVQAAFVRLLGRLKGLELHIALQGVTVNSIAVPESSLRLLIDVVSCI